MRKIELLLHSEKNRTLTRRRVSCGQTPAIIKQQITGSKDHKLYKKCAGVGEPRATMNRTARHGRLAGAASLAIGARLTVTARWSAVYCVDQLDPLLRSCRCLSESRPQCSRCLHLTRLGWPDDTVMNSSVKAWSWHTITTLSKDWLRW